MLRKPFAMNDFPEPIPPVSPMMRVFFIYNRKSTLFQALYQTLTLLFRETNGKMTGN